MASRAGLSLTAFFILVLLLLLLWYMQKRHDLSAEISTLRERFHLTNEQTAELLTSAWNTKYPDPKEKKHFDERTIRRWQAGQAPFPLTHVKMLKLFDDPILFDAIADYARREDLDMLDAFAGKRTPGSPARAMMLTTEAFQAFYADELERDKHLFPANYPVAATGNKKVVVMTQKPKKPRNRRKSR